MGELLQAAEDRLRRVCEEQRFKLRARIPANPDDDDLVISGGLHWARKEIDRLRKLLRETRMYALGSDCTTKLLIERIDAALAEGGSDG